MKLWFFRTPRNGWYYIATRKPSLEEIEQRDMSFRPRATNIFVSAKKPPRMPPIQPGECIPVELVPVEKNKKARKG